MSLGDSLASLHAVIGALMSLLRVRMSGGEGQMVDVSLFESVFNIMESLVPEYDLFGHVRERSGGTLPGISPSNTYRTRDGGFIVIAGNSDSIFKRLMRAIDRDDLASDARLRTNDGRVACAAELDAAISAWTGRQETQGALDALQAAEVPAERIYTAADIVADPHFLAREMILTSALPDGTQVKMPGVVPKLSDTPGLVHWLGPRLGEHTLTILRDLEVGEPDIAALALQGVIE